MRSKHSSSTLASALLLSFLLLVATTATLVSARLFADDGVVNPGPKYQRYRLDEFPKDKPFFQWWFFEIQDGSGRFHAFSYGMFRGGKSQQNTGAYLSYANRFRGPNSTMTGISKYERWPLDALSVSNYYDVTVGDDFSMQQLDSNDTLHLRGSLTHTEHYWFAENCAKDLPITWDLTLTRIFGWYGQQDLEWISETAGRGEIGWNTHSHDALVRGTITVGDQTYTFKEGTLARAYGDMNWGERFPASGPNPPVDDPWAWFRVVVPNQLDPEQDISIIAGTGLTDIGFPAYQVLGAFGDVRLTNATHVGMRKVVIWDETRFANPVVDTTNDGKLIRFDVARSNWVQYTDDLGTAKIPLTQVLTLETTNHKLTLTFDSRLDQYNRLLFPYDTFIFSDFEALGVRCNATIEITNQPTRSFSVDTAGLEYGYHTKINFPNPQQ